MDAGPTLLSPKPHDHDSKQIALLKYALGASFLIIFGLIGFAIYLFSEINELKVELHRDDTYLKSNDFDQRFIEEVSDIRKIMYAEIANQNQAIKGNVTLMDAKINTIDGEVKNKIDSVDHWDFEFSSLSSTIATENVAAPAKLPPGYLYKQCKFTYVSGSSKDNTSSGFSASMGELPFIRLVYAASNGFPNTWASGISIAFCNRNYLNPEYINWPEEYQ